MSLFPPLSLHWCLLVQSSRQISVMLHHCLYSSHLTIFPGDWWILSGIAIGANVSCTKFAAICQRGGSARVGTDWAQSGNDALSPSKWFDTTMVLGILLRSVGGMPSDTNTRTSSRLTDSEGCSSRAPFVLVNRTRAHLSVCSGSQYVLCTPPPDTINVSQRQQWHTNTQLHNICLVKILYNSQ